MTCFYFLLFGPRYLGVADLYLVSCTLRKKIYAKRTWQVNGLWWERVDVQERRIHGAWAFVSRKREISDHKWALGAFFCTENTSRALARLRSSTEAWPSLLQKQATDHNHRISPCFEVEIRDSIKANVCKVGRCPDSKQWRCQGQYLIGRRVWRTGDLVRIPFLTGFFFQSLLVFACNVAVQHFSGTKTIRKWHAMWRLP